MAGYPRITNPQSKATHTYRYGVQHYFYGFFLLPLLYLSIHYFRVAIDQRSLVSAAFAGILGLLTFISILNFDTKIECDLNGLTVTNLFAFNRKIDWAHISRLCIKRGRYDYCLIYSTRFQFPVKIVLGPGQILQEDGVLLATINERAGLTLANAKQGEWVYEKLPAAA